MNSTNFLSALVGAVLGFLVVRFLMDESLTASILTAILIGAAALVGMSIRARRTRN